MKPNIFIVGPSGTGKSSSLRNCDPLTTAILNSEQKALPFRGAGKFKMNVAVTGLDNEGTKEEPVWVPGMKGYWNMFDKAMGSKKTKIIVNESFTSLFEQQYAASKRFFKGFDLWGNLGEELTRILHRSKNTDKYVIFTGIDMVMEGENGVEERCIHVQGNWKKKVEKEFVIVLYTNTYTDEEGNIKYRFITNKIKGFENCPAKSPAGMLPPTMDNDIMEVIRLAEEYYGVEEEPKKESATKS